MKNLELRIG